MTKKRLIHYAKEPLGPLKSVEQSRGHSAFQVGKPAGLWLSVDTAWLDWVLRDGGARFMPSHAYDVDLHPDARILQLPQPRMLEEFTATYGTRLHPWLSQQMIDWPAVAGAFQGIVIAPYHWSCRLHPPTSWYYSWDVASGCIWDVSAIKSVVLVETELSAELDRTRTPFVEGGR